MIKTLLKFSPIPVILLSAAFWNNLHHPKAIYVLAAGSIVIALLSIKEVKPDTEKLKRLLIGFSIVSLVALFFSQTKNVGLNEILMESAVILLIVSLITSRYWVQFFYTTIPFIIGIQGFYSIIQYLTREESRVAGTFLSNIVEANYFPNALGLFWVITIPILWISENKKFSLTSILLTVLGVTSLFLTFSRGAIIAFALVCVIAGISFLRNGHTKKIVAVVVSIAVSALLAFGLTQVRGASELEANSIVDKATFQGTEAVTSVGERSQFFGGSLKLMLDRPLIGFGPSSFSYVYPKVQPMLLANAPHPHNVYLKVGVERGVIAMLILLAFTLAFGMTTVEKLKNIKEKRRVNATMIGAALVGGLAHNLIDFNFNFVLNIVIYGCLIALMIHMTNESKAEKKINKGLIFMTVVTVGLLGLSFMAHLHYSTAKTIFEDNRVGAIQALEAIGSRGYEDSHFIASDLYKQEGRLDAARRALVMQVDSNMHDAAAYNSYGLIAQSNSKAVDAFFNARETDPMNFFAYHLNYYRSLRDNSTLEDIRSSSQSVLDLLIDYIPLAKDNIHYTAQTGNIDDAIRLSQFFETYGDRRLRHKFKSARDQLEGFKEGFASN